MDLYKAKAQQTIDLEIKFNWDKTISLNFSSDCGKFGTDEMLDCYKLTAERLLDILQDREDYTEEEL